MFVFIKPPVSKRRIKCAPVSSDDVKELRQSVPYFV